MKKLAICFILLFTAFTLKAQVSLSSFKPLHGGIYGSLWFTQISILKAESGQALVLQVRDRKASPVFPKDESVLLIRLDNNEVLTLKRLPNQDEHSSFWNPGFDKVPGCNVYYTLAFYYCEDDAMEKLLSHNILKMRIELANADYRDEEIKKSRGEKLRSILQDLYDNVSQTQEHREAIKKDITDGF